MVIKHCTVCISCPTKQYVTYFQGMNSTDGTATATAMHTIVKQCYWYIVMGTLALLASLINVIIIGTNKSIRQRFLFPLALDFGGMINGLSYIICATRRLLNYYNLTYFTDTSTHECFFNVSFLVYSIICLRIYS